jgi:hypothetical protein
MEGSTGACIDGSKPMLPGASDGDNEPPGQHQKACFSFMDVFLKGRAEGLRRSDLRAGSCSDVRSEGRKGEMERHFRFPARNRVC